MALKEPPDVVEELLAATRAERLEASQRSSQCLFVDPRRESRVSFTLPTSTTPNIHRGPSLLRCVTGGEFKRNSDQRIETPEPNKEIHPLPPTLRPPRRPSIVRSHSADDINPAIGVIVDANSDDAQNLLDALELGSPIMKEPLPSSQPPAKHSCDPQSCPRDTQTTSHHHRPLRSNTTPQISAFMSPSMTLTDRNGILRSTILNNDSRNQLNSRSDSINSWNKQSTSSSNLHSSTCSHCGLASRGSNEACHEDIDGRGAGWQRRRSSMGPLKKFTKLMENYNKSHHTIIDGVDYTNLVRHSMCWMSTRF